MHTIPIVITVMSLITNNKKSANKNLRPEYNQVNLILMSKEKKRNKKTYI